MILEVLFLTLFCMSGGAWACYQVLKTLGCLRTKEELERAEREAGNDWPE